MAARSTRPPAATASSRYELIRPLGEGGAGAVFQVLDRETGEEVALKQLFRLDQKSVQRFKREFRALANLHHPNLVKLYDLQRADDAWFLTMEYVDGVDLKSALWRELSPGGSESAWIAHVSSAFHQLALGVQAVHRAGMLHRDLKPSNVVVAKSGRVVVLDFGLVRELGSAAVTIQGSVAGTPAYMAPEQAAGSDLTAASDWYAFGAMLYETLSGALPIEGTSAIALMRRKVAEDPEPLAAECAPTALADLCMALLQRDPVQRPNAAKILSVLESLFSQPQPRTVTEELSLQTDTGAAAPRARLFGRDVEVDKLNEALDYVSQGRSAVVHVRGTSGSGKSSLIEYFLDELRDSPRVYGPGVLVLRSRCYEREAMPFKALDGIVDALVNYLSRLADIDLGHLLPPEINALMQVFPAFERLRAVQVLTAGAAARGDAAQIRRNAERALRALSLNVASRLTLIMWIDDLQWGDLDSATTLQDWLQRPADAPLLIVLSYRSEEMVTSNCLRTLLTEAPDLAAQSQRFELSLKPLRDSDIERLCAHRLGASTAASTKITERIVVEAKGDPFLALQLTALAQAKGEHGEEVDLKALSVEQLVVRTSGLLAEPAQALLTVLAVAGRPLVPQLALSIAGAFRDGSSHIHALQGLRLVRTRIVDGQRLLEFYHDRVREAISASLTAAESTQLHARLLDALQTSAQSDPAWLHVLALGAGERALALHYGQMAAQSATSSLAFERSAELYARCVTLTDVREELAVLWSKLGLALARCRRGAEAADAYLKSIEFANESERIALMQLAASHLLRSGRYDEGDRLVQRVTAALHIEVPSSEAGMYAAIGWERARLAWFARTVKPQVGLNIPPDLLRRGEFYGMVAVWIAVYAPLRAALFQARTASLAFQHGDLSQMARSLCLTASIECMSGTNAAAARVDALLAKAQAWGERANHPNLQEELHSARAVCALMLGRPWDAIEPAALADEIYSQKSALDDKGDYYTMFGVRIVHVGALQALGRHKQAIPELRELIASARATDNVTTMLQVSPYVTIMDQVLDRCANSRERLDWERARLPTSGAGILHVMHMAAVLRAATTTGDFDWGQRVIDELWPGFEGSPVRRSAYLSYALHVGLARFLLNRHIVRDEPGDPTRTLRRCLRFLSGSAPEPLRKPAATRIRARMAYLRGDTAGARELFRASILHHQKIFAEDEVARERYALACLTPGTEGDSNKRAGIEALASCGVLEPEADLRVYYPELFRQPSG